MGESSSRSPWVLFGALAAVLVGGAGLALWLTRAPADAPASAPGPSAPSAPPPARDPAEPPDSVIREPAPVSRTPIPRPLREADSDSDWLGETDGRAQAPELDSDFPRVIAEGPEIAQALQAALQPHMQDMVGCLASWEAEQPGTFEGTAVFVFVLDRDGMVEMAVDQVETVPEGVMTCLGDLLWEDVSWPGIDADEPTEVTWPIKVSVNPDEED